MKQQLIIVALVLIIVLAFLGLPTRGNDSGVLSEYSVATFAGGCFWCMEAAFEAIDGVAES